MADKLKRFKTYGQQARREYSRNTYSRKAEVRAYRIEAIYSKTAPVECDARG